MVLVLLLSSRLSALARFCVAAKTGTVTILRDDPSAVRDLAARSGCGQDPSLRGQADRLALILHIVAVGIRKCSDCVCTGQRRTNVAEGGLSIGIRRCR